MSPHVHAFFDPVTFTYSYVVVDEETQCCAIIDSVLDYDPAAGHTSTAGAQRLVDFVRQHQLTVEWVLETHVHADHLSAAPFVQQEVGGLLAIGAEIIQVQDIFGEMFNAGTEFARDGSQFDRLFQDGDRFQLGNIEARAIHTPGHTPACMTYVIGDAVFVGDTLFMPDYGTARCDFPGGDAATLYHSIQKIFALPDHYRVFMCHDYKAPGRKDYRYETTIKEERETNIHVREGISEAEFVAMRTKRDETLSMPRLILPSVQVNMRAGNMPPAAENGITYLKIPLNTIE
ncbi:MAG TPA: MBL fold metallo-hydrolase [Alcanivoracaceae bacterium]|nr:MBL fold metallo-hydrolase [Alcanivoracaceae bacterium]